MKRQLIRKFLPLVGAAAGGEHREGWVVAHCPLAFWRHPSGRDRKPSFAIRIEPGDSFCNCFSCQWHGAQSDLILEIRRLEKARPSGQVLGLKAALELITDAQAELELELEAPDICASLDFGGTLEHLFPEWWLDSFVPVADSPAALAYLQSRKGGPVPLSVAKALDLRWDGAQRRVCFPVRDGEMRLRGLHGRAVDADNPLKYRMYTYQQQNNPLVWLGEHWVNPGRPLVVAESVFDLARVYEVYRNVVTPLTAALSLEKIRRMSDVPEQYTLFDQDLAGKRARDKYADSLPFCQVIHLDLPKPYGDAGDTPVELLAELLGEHLELDGPPGFAS